MSDRTALPPLPTDYAPLTARRRDWEAALARMADPPYDLALAIRRHLGAFGPDERVTIRLPRPWAADVVSALSEVNAWAVRAEADPAARWVQDWRARTRAEDGRMRRWARRLGRAARWWFAPGTAWDRRDAWDRRRASSGRSGEGSR